MKKYLYDYIKEIDRLIDRKRINEDIVHNHLMKIKFFQHERLIHLLVTLGYSLIFIIMVIVTMKVIWFMPIMVIMMIILMFYVVHYFNLENGVQYLYKQYDKMIELIDN